MSAMDNTWQGKRPQSIKMVQHSETRPATSSAMRRPGRTVTVRSTPHRLRCVWTKTERGLRCQWVADE